MARKQDIGEMVALSMREILESEEHQKIFNKTAAKKKCCACEGKCARKCPCKTDGGCKKACGPCAENTKKKASSEETEKNKKCCGEKCPCAEGGDCGDCSACADGKTAADATLDMIGSLLAMSEKQEELGLTESAEQSLKAANALMLELQKKAQALMDENEVSALDAFETDPEDAFESLTEDESSTPNVDAVLDEIAKKHPDFFSQMSRRRNEAVPVENSYDLDSILQDQGDLPPETESTYALHPPSSRHARKHKFVRNPVPGHGPTPPSEAELAEKAQEELDGGRNNYIMYKHTPEELDRLFEEAIRDMPVAPGPARDPNKLPAGPTYRPPSEQHTELFSDEELDEALKPTISVGKLDTLVSKFAFEAEDEYSTEHSSLDEMMDEFLEQSGDENSADDFEEEDAEKLFEAKDMTEIMSHWTGGEGDPLYRVTSMFYAGKTPDIEDVVSARDIVESLFNKELSGDELNMDNANELHKIHTFLVDYLEGKGYPEPGSYLDADVDSEDDAEEDSLMDAYMSILSGPPETTGGTR